MRWTRQLTRWREPQWVSGEFTITRLDDPDEFDPEGRHRAQYTLWRGDPSKGDALDMGYRLADLKAVAERLARRA